MSAAVDEPPIQCSVDAAVQRVFGSAGAFIGRHPWPFVLTPLLLCAVSAVGFVNFAQENSVRVQFTPVNSPSRREYQVSQEYHQESGGLFLCWALVKADDDGDLLRKEYAEAVLRLIDALTNQITVPFDGHHVNFKSVCRSYCNMNDALEQFLSLRHILLEHNSSAPVNPIVQLTYPQMQTKTRSVYIADSIHGYTLGDNDQIESSRVIQLFFFSITNPKQDQVLKEWEWQVYKQLDGLEPSLKVYINSENLISYEVARTGTSAAPLLVLSFLATMTFTIVSNLRRVTGAGVVAECALGVCGPIIASMGAFGLLLAAGVKYQPICAVTVFLVLAVGVDDVFVMQQAWAHLPASASVERRMRLMMSEAGPSITITSITNALSFAIGLLSTTPAIQTFCAFTISAVLVSFLFQLSFFSGVMVLNARQQLKRTAGCCPPKDKTAPVEKVVVCNAVPRSTSQHIWFAWSTFIVSWYARLLCLAAMALYLFVAVLGFMKMEAQIDVRKLLLDDSPMLEFERIMREQVMSEMQQLNIYVMNPPDLRLASNRARVFQLAGDMERTPSAFGPSSTTLWLKYYMQYVEFDTPNANQTSGFDARPGGSFFTYKLLPEFLNSSRYLEPFVHLNKSACALDLPECVHNYFFTTGYYNVTDFHSRNLALRWWRAVCANHSQMQVSVYDSLNFFADQVESIESTTKQTSLMALLCMAVVCTVFIPNAVSIVCASLSVLSVNVGVLGLLVHWGIDLDPLSMSGLLMSIGFSVDYTAHISYHYYKSAHERLYNALNCIGWPMVQSGVSTVLAVAVLNIHGSYMLVVFFKTIFLVCTLGLWHGLFVLPVCLTSVPRCLQPSPPPTDAPEPKHNNRTQPATQSDAASVDSGHPASISGDNVE